MTTAKRWLPSTTPAIVAGTLAAAVTYGLHALGIIPTDLTEPLTAVVGLLTASIVQPPAKGDPTTLGELVAHEIKAQLDNEPASIQALVKAAVVTINQPAGQNKPQVKVEPKVAAVIAQAVVNEQPLVEVGSAPMTEAPHVTQ